MTQNSNSSYFAEFDIKTMTRKLVSASCPNDRCKANLVFASDAPNVHCMSCGLQHKKEMIRDVISFHDSKAPADTKVNGISSYVCKLLSPLLTRYGMAKETGEAKLLSKMGKGETFDCGRLCSRAFLIEPCHLNIPGYGCDSTGSLDYLAETLREIKWANANNERLVPIHADGDGHCLVHAISRALVGRELFWHALRENLQCHFQEKLELYKIHFQDFIYNSEWLEIIDECKPDFVPRDGDLLGLRNIHIFGLANVLKRPIVLLDSIIGMNSSGDYSGVFLPTLCDKDDCLDKDGHLNKPLCIAWSSSGRNHYIPLVGIEGKPAPRLPRSMLQKAWGMPVDLINEYIDFDENDCCTIGGNKLGDRYIRKLTEAMDKLYYENNLVPPTLVADTYQLLRKKSMIDSMKPDTVMHVCKQLIRQGQLYRCLNCECLNNVNRPEDWVNQNDPYEQLEDVLLYPYVRKDFLQPDENKTTSVRCEYCNVNQLRLVDIDGKVCYQNGDLVASCHGNKYYWNGTHYNNLPQILPLKLDWKSKKLEVKVFWFENEVDPSLNSNAFEIGQQLVQEHFPGEFNTESLVTSLVNQILELTKIKGAARLSAAAAAAAAAPTHPQADSSHLLPGRNEQKRFSTEFDRDVISEKTRMLMEALDSAIASQTTNAVQEEGGSRSGVSDFQSAVEKVESLLGAVSRPEHYQLLQPQPQPQGEPRKSLPMQKSSQSNSALFEPSPSKRAAKTKRPSTKSIRLSTSSGQKVLLSLETDVTFEELQALITQELGIPAAQQKIRMGFPPRQLCPTSHADLVPLSHGDRLEVEILPEEDFFGADPLNALLLAAHLQGKDIWSYIQECPDFFHKEGIIYCQMQRARKQVHGLHFTIPFLPGKTFCYSSSSDVVQICLKSYGHFDVEPGIEWKVQEIPLTLLRPCLSPMAPHSNNNNNNQSHSRQHSKAQPPFTGQGRSMVSRRREAAKMTAMSSPPAKKDLPSSGGGGDPANPAEHTNITPYQRLGPGFSILGGGEMSSNVTNTSLEKIRALAAHIVPPHLDYTREQDEDELHGDEQNQMETT